MNNPINARLLPAPVNGGYCDEDYFIWCGSCVKGEDGRYHLFASRWRKELGFGVHWLFNCEIVRAASPVPEGPYRFEEVVLGRRDRGYFDGMNQHNPHIQYWNGTYYLYYMGTTYGGRYLGRETSFPLSEARRSGITRELGWRHPDRYSALGKGRTNPFCFPAWDSGTAPSQPIQPLQFWQMAVPI